jgi:seryl-tRNA synthetase
MSSFVFYKIQFEGKIESLYEFIQNKDWNVSIKMPEKGILYMKLPIDIEDEVVFHQDMTFDENTQSKFGNFVQITESDYEAASNLEMPKSSENAPKEEKSQNFYETINKNIEKAEKKSKELDSKINEFNTKETTSQQILRSLSKSLEDLPNLISESIPSNINLENFEKNIVGTYKDPYDYFFSQNYLITFFIFAVICLIVFNF